MHFNTDDINQDKVLIWPVSYHPNTVLLLMLAIRGDFFRASLVSLVKEKWLGYHWSDFCISFYHFANGLSVNGMWGPGHGRCASGWFTTGIQVFLRASLPWAWLKASQPLAQELEVGGLVGRLCVCIGTCTAHISPLKILRWNCLQNAFSVLGTWGEGGGTPWKTKYYILISAFSESCSEKIRVCVHLL